MCELLVWIEDSEKNDDPALDAKRGKAGNVIVTCPDGWPWSEAELNHPHWRIVALPGVEADDVLIQQLERTEEQQRKMDDPLDPLASPISNQRLRHRIWSLDVTALSKTGVRSKTTITKAQLRAGVKKLKALANDD